MQYRKITWLCAVSLTLLAGCNSYKGDFVQKSEAELAAMEELNGQAHDAFVLGNYEEAERILRSISSERTVSRPLYQLELISVLLMKGKNEEAHKLMMSLHDDLETVFDAQLEEKAQSVWHGEVNKVYKGDSYERSTLYALMALSFIRQQNYEDALRCVKNGLLADADSNSENALDDYTLLHYLGYLSSMKLDRRDEAEEYLRALRTAMKERGLKSELAKSCFAPLQREDSNVLLAIWAGQPPTVTRTGEYGEVRSIIQGVNYFDAIGISVDGNAEFFSPNNLADVNYQATTRGGRLMDNVLADKATAKKVVEMSRNIFFVVGTGLWTAGVSSMSNPTVGVCLMGSGAGCYVIGGTLWVIGSFMNPEADGRYWRNIPCQLYIVPLSLPAGKHRIAIKGYSTSDRAGFLYHDIDVPQGNGNIQVIHIPMFSQGQLMQSAREAKYQAERAKALNMADMNRFAKELK